MNRATFLVVSFAALFYAAAAHAQSLDWVRQIGLGPDEKGWSASADGSGNVVVAGITATDSTANGFLRKYDTDGSLVRTQQVGTEGDFPTAITASALGNVYATGTANFSDRWDSYLSKYDEGGELLWTSRFVPPTEPSSWGPTEWYLSEYVGAGETDGVYTAGRTTVPVEIDIPPGGDSVAAAGPSSTPRANVFVSKNDADGNRLWIQRLGSDFNDWATGISTDGSGNVYVTGVTPGAIEGTANGGFDVFVSKYGADGVVQWTRQFGTTQNDVSRGISVDGLGNVFISGSTDGVLAGAGFGFRNAFVTKYAADGSLLWVRQLDSGVVDEGGGVAADGLGGAYVTGWTWGDLAGTNAGDSDVFISRFGADGSLLWTRPFGTDREDAATGVTIDNLGNLFFLGSTRPTVAATDAGQLDVFLAKFSVVPEPSTLAMLAGLSLFTWRKRPNYFDGEHWSAKTAASCQPIYKV